MKFRYKKGDILLYKKKTLVSKIISWFTGSEYTHTAMYVGNGNIIDAWWGGVNLRHLSEDEGKYEITVVRHKTAKPSDLELAVQWSLQQIGAGYDYLGIIGIGLYILGISKKNWYDDRNRYWCSELNIDAFIHANQPTDANENTFKVSPGDVHKDSHFREMVTIR